MKKLLGLVKSASQWQVVTITTLVAIGLSVLVTIFMIGIGRNVSVDGWILTVATPLVVAPLASWIPIHLLIAIGRLEAEMRILASQDALTMLLNRRAFIEKLELQAKLAKRGSDRLSVVMLDLDFFKKVNDTYGHAGGDAVLKSFSKVLASHLRDGDFVGRIGGEEFCATLVNTDAIGAVKYAEKILRAVRNTSVTVGHKQIRYTTSIGVAEFSIPESTDTLLAHADEALYAAKRDGRDQVKFFPISKECHETA